MASRVLADARALVLFAAWAPQQIERALELGEEFREIAVSFLAVAERVDRRLDAAIAMGERLDGRAAELIELGVSVRELGRRFDERGAEISERANRVAETGEELIAVLPAFERAVAMAAPLEGAIDRVGRLVDMLPGGAAARRRTEQAAETARGERPGSEDPAPRAADA